MRFFLCLLLVLSFCGCSQSTDVPSLTQCYPCTYILSGEMGGIACSFSLEMNAVGKGTLSFRAPEALAGVQFLVHSLPEVDAESDALQYAERGLTVRVGAVEIPLSEGAYPATIYGVIKAFSTTNDKLSDVSKQDNSTRMTFTYPDGYLTFTVTADGTPTHVYIDLYGTVCDLTIENITYKENTL